jgi:hypothetical protein
MDNVAAVIGRMSELTISLVSFPMRPASGFSRVLDAAMGTGPTALVAPGETVGPGFVIGLVGSTGVSDIRHLHFEVRHGGQPVDPAPYLGML